jgi:hypothetical protein
MGMVAVLGLGDSLKEYEGGFAIGVNDIWRYVETEAVVVLDYERVFTPDRLKVIKLCKPEAFYSQIVAWDIRPDFRKIDLIPGYPDHAVDLDLAGFYKSFCSPFVAVQIAFKIYKAEEIHLYGVDLVNHPHLDFNICQKIKLHFANLRKALTAKGCQFIVHGKGILTPQM